AVHLSPPVLELREDLESLEGIDHDQVEAALLLDRLDAGLEGVDPILLLAEDVGRGPRVEDDEGALRHVELQPERAHLFQEARGPLLQAHVQAVETFPGRVVEQNREGERGFHRPWRAFDQDQMAPWDSALQALIEALDERRDARGSRCLRNRCGRYG